MINRLVLIALIQVCLAAWSRAASPQITTLNVQCDRSGMRVNVAFDQPFNGIIFSKGHYSDLGCRYLQPNAGATTYDFAIPVDKCGTNTLDIDGEDGNKPKRGFENIVVFQNDPTYQEIWDHARMVVCRYTLEDDFDLKEKRVVFRPVVIDMLDVVSIPVRDADGQQSRVDCWMEITKGRFPATSAIDSAVKVGNPLTLAIFVRDPRKRTDIRVKDCYAYDDPQVAENNGPALLQLTDFDGCPTKPKLIEVWRRTTDAGPTGATIIAFTTVTAFKFPDRPDLQLTCNIELCRNQCTQRCSAELPNPVSIGSWTTPIDDGSGGGSVGPAPGTTAAPDVTTSGGDGDDNGSTEGNGGDGDGDDGGDGETEETTPKSEMASTEEPTDESDTDGDSESASSTTEAPSEGGSEEEEEGKEEGDSEGGDEASTTTTTEAPAEGEGGDSEESEGDGEDNEETKEAEPKEAGEASTTEAPETSSEESSEESDESGSSEEEEKTDTNEASSEESSEESGEDETDNEESENDEEAAESKAKIKATEAPKKSAKTKASTTTTTTTTAPSTTTKKTKTTKKAKSQKGTKATTPKPKSPKSAAQVRPPNDRLNSIDQIHWSTSTLRPLKELMDFKPKSQSNNNKKSKKSQKIVKPTTTSTTTTTTTTTTAPTTTKSSKKSSNKNKSNKKPTTTAAPKLNPVRRARAPSSSHPDEFPHLHVLEEAKKAQTNRRQNPFSKFQSMSQTKRSTISPNITSVVITEAFAPNTTSRASLQRLRYRNSHIRQEQQTSADQRSLRENPLVARKQSPRRSDYLENPEFEAFNQFRNFQAMRINRPNHRVVRSVDLRYSDPDSKPVIFQTRIHSALLVI